MLYKKIVFIFFYLFIVASYSFASNISEYKYEVSSYAISLKSKYNLKKINVKYNIFEIKNKYAAMYLLSDNNVAVAVCSALDNGKLNDCQSTLLYGLNYKNVAPINFTFSSDKKFINFNMDLDKDKKPYTISVKSNDNKFYFHSYTKTDDKNNEYYSSFLERAIYSDMGYTADFILPLSDITPATLIHHRFKDIEYFFKENPNTAPFMYNKLFKTSGNIISIESANNDKLSVIAVITSYEPYDYNYNNRNETYTAYICKPDFIDCIESDMAVHDNSEHTESIWAKNDYITFKTFKNTHDGSKEQYNYVTYKLKNGKYYLDKIVEMQVKTTGLLVEHISTIKYDSKGNLTIPFK